MKEKDIQDYIDGEMMKVNKLLSEIDEKIQATDSNTHFGDGYKTACLHIRHNIFRIWGPRG